jgi:hypothetical protein
LLRRKQHRKKPPLRRQLKPSLKRNSNPKNHEPG